MRMDGEREPQHEMERKRAENILHDVEGRFATFAAKRDTIFAAHQNDPQPGTYMTVLNDITFYISDVDRAQKIIFTAFEAALTARDKKSKALLRKDMVRAHDLSQTLYAAWDETMHKAAELGALPPADELLVANQILKNCLASVQMLHHFLLVLLETRSDEETGEIPKEDEDRLESFFTTLTDMAESATDRADIARKGAPDNQEFVEECTELIKKVNGFIEEVQEVRGMAIEFGVLPDPDYFDEDDENR